MILIKKGREPNSLVNFRAKSSNFDELPSEVKSELRTRLYKEQHGLCAYCMSRIRDDNTSKIEHYVARNDSNQLDYSNLLLVCKGQYGDGNTNSTCDTRKGNGIVQINPQNVNHTNTIFYSNTGVIKSTNNTYNNDINEFLNLNHKLLVINRRNALVALKKSLYKNYENKEADYDKIKKSLLKKSIYEPYIGILIWYLNKR